MILGRKKALHDHIIECLLIKPLTVLELQQVLFLNKMRPTIQGIYKTLRDLVQNDIVVKQKQHYSISNVWREKAANLFAAKSRFRLSEGEDVTYRFRRLEHLDAFWKHTLADIGLETNHYPIFHFTPHQFWSLVPGRKGSEHEYYADLERSKILAYTIVGGNDPCDKIVRNSLRTNFHQIFLDPLINFNRRDHISSIGNYVLTTRISPRLAKQIDDVYRSTLDEESLSIKLGLLFQKPGIITLIVENNHQKAFSIRKKLSTNFHIPLEIRKRINLL